MTNHAAILRQIDKEAEPYVEQWLDLAEVFAGFRKLASENGMDWGQIKALLKARAQDRRAGGSKYVDRIIEKADFASAYADMLGLGTPKMNENNFSAEVIRDEVGAEVLPPHDEDGVIIEPATIIVAAGEAGTRTSSCPQAGLTVSPTLSEPASAPSDAEAGQGDVAERQQPEGLAFLTSSVAPPSIPEPATAPPKAVAAAPVESAPPSPGSTIPGAPITGEMPDIPAFLRRTA